MDTITKKVSSDELGYPFLKQEMTKYPFGITPFSKQVRFYQKNIIPTPHKKALLTYIVEES